VSVVILIWTEKISFGSDVSDEVRQRNEMVFSKLHSLLRSVIKLVPMSVYVGIIFNCLCT